jgi:dihydroflavonol-4-reductase
VFTLLSELTGIPPPHRRVPYVVALAAACLSELAADVWTHRAPAATLTGVKLTRRRMHFEPSASLTELGLQPRPVQSALQDAVAWYREMRWV